MGRWVWQGTRRGRRGWESIRANRIRPEVYDFLLGGKNNFAVDRETAEKALKSWGTARSAARENRAFLGRAVRYLAAEAGIRQFLDIGTGLPSAEQRARGGAGRGAGVPGSSTWTTTRWCWRTPGRC